MSTMSSSATSSTSSINSRVERQLTVMFSLLPSLSDVTLLTEDGYRIEAHKIVLASSLHYFQSMFVGPVTSSFPTTSKTMAMPYVESSAPEVVIRGVDGRALEQIVRWCYSLPVSCNGDNVQLLLTAAKMLSASEVESTCCDFIRRHMQHENVLGISDFAEHIGCFDLKKTCLDYIHRNFLSIIVTEEFLRLDASRLSEIISSDALDTGSKGEEAVIQSLVAWVDYDRNRRKDYLPQLLHHVRFPRIPRENLMFLEEMYPSLNQDMAYKDLLIEAFKYHLCKEQMANVAQENTRFKMRVPIGRPKVLVVIGGQAPKAIKQCECFDFESESWYELKSELPTRRCRAGVVVLDGLVYAVGGFNGTQRVRTVDSYDPQTNRWSTCPPMEARRSTLGVGVLDRRIYAVGGFDGSIGLQSAEVFDPVSGIWRGIAAMSTRRSSVGVTALNGYLYAIGGYDGGSRQCLSSVEYYDPSTDSWLLAPDMSMRRSGAAVGVLANRLIVCGGHDGPAVRKSVESYDPTTATWVQLSDMMVARRNAGVVSKDGLLYVIGGDDSQQNLATVEVFDPRNNSWSLLPKSMSIGRSYAGVCIIDKF